jgi:hypothetical protein
MVPELLIRKLVKEGKNILLFILKIDDNARQHPVLANNSQKVTLTSVNSQAYLSKLCLNKSSSCSQGLSCTHLGLLFQ